MLEYNAGIESSESRLPIPDGRLLGKVRWDYCLRLGRCSSTSRLLLPITTTTLIFLLPLLLLPFYMRREVTELQDPGVDKEAFGSTKISMPTLLPALVCLARAPRGQGSPLHTVHTNSQRLKLSHGRRSPTSLAPCTTKPLDADVGQIICHVRLLAATPMCPRLVLHSILRANASRIVDGLEFTPPKRYSTLSTFLRHLDDEVDVHVWAETSAVLVLLCTGGFDYPSRIKAK